MRCVFQGWRAGWLLGGRQRGRVDTGGDAALRDEEQRSATRSHVPCLSNPVLAVNAPSDLFGEE